jgi:hypothetical protein
MPLVIPCDLGGPECIISLGNMPTFRATVPEAAVYENRQFCSWKEEIGLAGEVCPLNRPTGQARPDQSHLKT